MSDGAATVARLDSVGHVERSPCVSYVKRRINGTCIAERNKSAGVETEAEAPRAVERQGWTLDEQIAIPGLYCFGRRRPVGFSDLDRRFSITQSARLSRNYCCTVIWRLQSRCEHVPQIGLHGDLRAPSGQTLIKQETIGRTRRICERPHEGYAQVRISERRDRAPARGIAVGLRSDEAGIFRDAFSDFQAGFRLGGLWKQLATMGAKSECITDRRRLRRSALDQRGNPVYQALRKARTRVSACRDKEPVRAGCHPANAASKCFLG